MMKLKKMVAISALTAIVLVLVIPIMIFQFPFLVGGENSYMVMSGSMSPALRPGDLIIVSDTDFEVGDVVTVGSGESTYTHRVIEELEYGFILKGDANEDPDPSLIEASQIIGKVSIVFPFGHLYTPYGFASLVVAPAALIVGKQMHTLHLFTKKRRNGSKAKWRRKSRKFSVLDASTLLLALILTVSTTRLIAPHFIAGSNSYFSDTEWATAFFQADIWEIDADIDINPDTLNLNSQGQWIMVYAMIDTDYDENNIDISTVKLETIIAEWGEVQVDGRLMVKFGRFEVIDYLIGLGNGDGDVVELTVSGELDGITFKGSDTINLVWN